MDASANQDGQNQDGQNQDGQNQDGQNRDGQNQYGPNGRTCRSCGAPMDSRFCAACGADSQVPEGGSEGSKRRLLVSGAVGLGLLVAAVGAFLVGMNTSDSEDAVSTRETTTTAEPTTAPPTTSTTTTAPPTTASTTTTVLVDPSVLAASQFASLAKQNCDLSMIPDPSYVTAAPAGGDTFVITDLEGTTVLFHPASRTVTSMEGSLGELPLGYSFGCEPTVFLGTSH